jgi:hypothetical protein
MAKRKRPAVPSKKSGGGGGVNKGVALLVLAALIPFSLPTVVLLFFTMLPTAAAWAGEKGKNKYAWLCVGGLNFAGVIPYLFSLWFGVHTLDEAFDLLSDASVLLWAYGASAIGWLLYMGMPPVVSSWLSFTNDRRVAALKAAQKRLVDDWGDEVGKKSV